MGAFSLRNLSFVSLISRAPKADSKRAGKVFFCPPLQLNKGENQHGMSLGRGQASSLKGGMVPEILYHP